MIEKKSLAFGLTLPCLFGPAGLIYSNIWLGLILTFISLPFFIISCFTVVGAIIMILIVHPFCMILSAIAISANNSGKKVITSKFIGYILIFFIIIYYIFSVK